MRILVLSVNHRTAPVEVRERLALDGDRLEAALRALQQAHPAAETVILSTCNRTELYLARPSHQAPNAADLATFLATQCGLDAPAIVAAGLQRENDHALAHLFRVCAGLESMVLGEPQILGQVRRAYEIAAAQKTVGPVLHRVFQQALAIGKRARAQTGIDAGRVSVASVAVDFARQVFDRFDDKTIVAIGAGEMGKVMLKRLIALRPGRLWLTNRTLERARRLADDLGLGADQGGVRHFEALDELLVEADVILTCTGASQPIITADRFRPLIRRRRSRPICIVDAAVPRDVEPKVGQLTNVYLYDIDDLQRVVGETHGQRAQQVEACEALLADAVRDCAAEIRHRDVGILVRALRERLHELGRAENERTQRKLAAASAHEVNELIEEHTHRLVNKILHLPLSQLDPREGDSAALAFYAAALRRLFDLADSATPGAAGFAQVPPTLADAAPPDAPPPNEVFDPPASNATIAASSQPPAHSKEPSPATPQSRSA